MRCSRKRQIDTDCIHAPAHISPLACPSVLVFLVIRTFNGCTLCSQRLLASLPDPELRTVLPYRKGVTTCKNKWTMYPACPYVGPQPVRDNFPVPGCHVPLPPPQKPSPQGGGRGEGGNTQVTKCSKHARLAMHMQQCSAVPSQSAGATELLCNTFLRLWSLSALLSRILSTPGDLHSTKQIGRTTGLLTAA